LTTEVTDLNLTADPDLSAFVAAECTRLGVPGAAAGIIAGGTSYGCTHGVTDVDHPRPVDADTLFMIGSTTKTLTATAVMTLVRDGLVSLDDRLVKHLPELELMDGAARDAVTVGQLLDHTAGWRGDLEVETGWGDDALSRALRECVAKVPQTFPPGSMASYNNLALVVAGRLIEQLTGEGFEAAVHTRVLEPLGMADTFFFPWEVVTRPVATGHVTRDGLPAPAYTWPMSRASGPAGGAVSTLSDQLRYARFHLDGTCPGKPPLDDELRRSMQQPRVALPATLSGIGISWLLQTIDGRRLVTHGGNCSNLFVSSFALAPDEQFAVTVLTNSRGGGVLGGSVTKWAMEHYLGRLPTSPPDPLPLTPALVTDYVGRYDAGQWDLQVTESQGRLFVEMQLTDIPVGTPEEVLATFRAPPTEVVLAATDVLAPAASPGDTSGDFVRGADGQVAWLRYGLRLARRRA
jgi:CubicO group peptidase (beta-lactamase class C family)